MPDGIDGFINDKMSRSIDAISEALQYEASEAKKNRDNADSSIKGADYPTDSFTGGKSKLARDDVSQADIAINSLLAELGGNTRNIGKSIDNIERENFLKRVREGKTYYREADEDVDQGLVNGLVTPYELIANIDVKMPSGLNDALWMLAPIPMLIGELVTNFVKLFSVNEETFVEDTIKMLALQDRVKEELGKVVK